MGLADTFGGWAQQYGPGILQGLSRAFEQTPMGRSSGMQGYQGPMGPQLGFAAPRARTGGYGGPRRKRRGLSAADIRGAQKVARLVQHFGFRPKIKARKRGR